MESPSALHADEVDSGVDQGRAAYDALSTSARGEFAMPKVSAGSLNALLMDMQ